MKNPPVLLALAHHSFFFQAEDGIRDTSVTGVQTCALPILPGQSIGPPNTAIGGIAVGPPGAPPPVAAAPVASGADKIRVSLSGQVNRAIIYEIGRASCRARA